jgi:hypothetical protein
MTRHDVDVLAFFVSNWKLLNNNQGLRSCLKLDLADYCEKNCLHFDRERYWSQVAPVNTLGGLEDDACEGDDEIELPTVSPWQPRIEWCNMFYGASWQYHVVQR